MLVFFFCAEIRQMVKRYVALITTKMETYAQVKNILHEKDNLKITYVKYFYILYRFHSIFVHRNGYRQGDLYRIYLSIYCNCIIYILCNLQSVPPVTMASIVLKYASIHFMVKGVLKNVNVPIVIISRVAYSTKMQQVNTILCKHSFHKCNCNVIHN